jgi:hypothetical protein
MYDFPAGRPDELEAKKGETINVVAQWDSDWLMAKPVERFGGPGLIPVLFIEIKDISTGKPVPDAQEAIRRAGLPHSPALLAAEPVLSPAEMKPLTIRRKDIVSLQDLGPSIEYTHSEISQEEVPKMRIARSSFSNETAAQWPLDRVLLWLTTNLFTPLTPLIAYSFMLAIEYRGPPVILLILQLKDSGTNWVYIGVLHPSTFIKEFRVQPNASAII